ncbi:MAG: guanylate kinase [Verrucomicrobia bacterium]|nr:guanylate kinase [Verrucomicrobiota bacterium]
MALVLVISGPAGSGKTTLCETLLERYPDNVRRLVTTTTRQPRPGERDGIDYHFLSEAEFKRRIDVGAFMEWAQVHGRYYGSEKKYVYHTLKAGFDLLLNIDVQGAEQYRTAEQGDDFLRGKLLTIFIQPRDLEQIKERMAARGADDPKEIERRLASARAELVHAPRFHHVITSGTREQDFAALEQLYLNARRNCSR